MSDAFFSQVVKEKKAGHRKTSDGRESGNLGEYRAQVEEIREESTECTKQAENVKPDGEANRFGSWAAKPKLEEGGGESNGRNDYYSQRATKSGPAGVEHDEGESAQQETRGDDGPAAGQVGKWFGQSDVVFAGSGQRLNCSRRGG